MPDVAWYAAAMRYALLMATALLALACKQTGEDSSGGPPEGTFVCGEDYDGEQVYCIEGEEFCFELESDQDPSEFYCESLGSTCDLESTDWCDCIFADLQCHEDHSCDPGRYVSCL